MRSFKVIERPLRVLSDARRSIAAQEKLVTETLKEDGCLRYELHQSLDNGAVRIFVESWESEAKWQAHMEGAAMQRFLASGVGDYFADFSLHRLEKVAG